MVHYTALHRWPAPGDAHGGRDRQSACYWYTALTFLRMISAINRVIALCFVDSELWCSVLCIRPGPGLCLLLTTIRSPFATVPRPHRRFPVINVLKLNWKSISILPCLTYPNLMAVTACLMCWCQDRLGWSGNAVYCADWVPWHVSTCASPVTLWPPSGADHHCHHCHHHCHRDTPHESDLWQERGRAQTEYFPVTWSPGLRLRPVKLAVSVIRQLVKSSRVTIIGFTV